MASSQLLAKQDHELLTTLELDDLQAHVKKQVRHPRCAAAPRVPCGRRHVARLACLRHLPQMEEGFCDSRINRAIIRLYSLHPDELDEDVVVNILALVSCQRVPPAFQPGTPAAPWNTPLLRRHLARSPIAESHCTSRA